MAARDSRDNGTRCFQRALRGLNSRIMIALRACEQSADRSHFSDGSLTAEPRVQPATRSAQSSAAPAQPGRALNAPLDASASEAAPALRQDRKSTRLNSSHRCISYAVFCLKKKKKT